ncbi:MAG: hypothetical protein NkDv07_0807 [Candidatus Improbicoccus devescovinae]|nr:MAG: hypothetical protein NkDv07_0807 [Candidatus Improbicoccus devescovinae]
MKKTLVIVSAFLLIFISGCNIFNKQNVVPVLNTNFNSKGMAIVGEKEYDFNVSHDNEKNTNIDLKIHEGNTVVMKWDASGMQSIETNGITNNISGFCPDSHWNTLVRIFNDMHDTQKFEIISKNKDNNKLKSTINTMSIEITTDVDGNLQEITIPEKNIKSVFKKSV